MGILHRKFYDSVISINIINKLGKISTIGSGFLVSFQNINYLVTNKHVIKDQDHFMVNLNGSTSKNRRHMIFKGVQNMKRLFHPNKDVDLVLIEISESQSVESAYYLPLERTAQTINQLMEQGVFEGDEVFIVGHPMNLTLNNHLYPIVRAGIIAEISSLYTFNFPIKTFKLDCIAFPGNSGGPVFLKPQLIKYKDTKSIKEMKLIGILSGGWMSRTIGNSVINLELSVAIATDYLFEILQSKDSYKNLI